ncbi:hypothetical protein [Halobacillus sp. Marseille-Q1614]|uniref:hypothetical protein n=1 Tax=Halobacillus sp. Marseille-Q1614 TaxID=2709134 RepID=UPI001570BB8E|nr:hypothetical protein [Halobacillus sp. Marseille-Q1614]
MGRLAMALIAVFVLSFGSFTGTNIVEAKEEKPPTARETMGSTKFGGSWKDGQVGFEAGCALSEWLGWFECHESQVSWK